MRRTTLILGTAALSGCGTISQFAGEPFEPVAVAPDAPANWSAAGLAGTPEHGDWLAQFGDPDVYLLVSETLARNPSLRAQAAVVLAFEADARAQRGSRLPFISGGATSGLTRTAQENFFGDVVSGESALYGLSVDASWEADLWGRLQAGVNLADSEYLVSEADYAALRLSLSARTVLAWIELNAALIQERVAIDTLAARARTVSLTERRMARGLATALDVRLARSAEAQAEASIAQQQRLRDEAARRLEVLLGRYPSAQITVDAALPALRPIAPSANPTLLLARRPDIAASEARVVSAGLRAEQARLALLPSLNVNASLSTSADTLGDALDPALIASRAIANLTQPLYAGGQIRARRDAFYARAETALANYASTVLAAWREVEDTLAADLRLAAQEQAQARALEEARFAEELAERQYQNGLVSIFNLIDAQTRRLSAESALVSVRASRATNRVNYHLALGGSLPDAVALAEPAFDLIPPES